MNLHQLDKNIKDKFAYLPAKIKGMVVTQEHGPLLIQSGLHSDMFNIICSSGKDTKEGWLRSVASFQKQKQSFAVWIGFETDPDWLIDELSQLGLNPSEDELAMVASLKEFIPPASKEGFSFQHVTDSKGIQDLTTVMHSICSDSEKEAITQFFLLSQPYLTGPSSLFNFFIGYSEGKPIATASTFNAEGITSIFDVIVLPSHQGHGFGRHITQLAMLKAWESGAELTALTATNDAKYLYEKLGFQAVKKMKVYT